MNTPKKNTRGIIVFVSIFLFFALHTVAQPSNLRLWYDKPATNWEATIPLGNGRLGAMPDGGVFNENVVLNDITLWSGASQNADKPNAHEYLPAIQQFLLEGKNIEAQELMSKHFVCEGKGSGEGNGAGEPYGSYQLLGNLKLSYDYGSDSTQIQPQNYIRQLSLDEAISKTQFSIGSATYTREYFTSFGNDIVVIRLTANEKNKINFSLSIDRPENFSVKTIGNQLQMQGQLNNGTDGKGMQYITRIEIKPEGGELNVDGNSLDVKNANVATIYISSKTDYKDPSYLTSSEYILKKSFKKEYAEEKAKHISNYQTLFKRANLVLGGTDKDNLPTDKRLEAFVSDPSDNGLINLYFQFGRYLLIGSTRHGLLPPNLQGLWANTINTPWNGDYHLNINLQMNHWPLEVTNLGTLNEPFFDLVKGIIPSGEKTAKAYYNGDGWVTHVITNIWQYTSPGEHYSWGSYNSGSAWLCQMLWAHYEFTKDKVYLEKLYPILKGSAQFYLSTMIEEPTHKWLVTAPSNSPENAFILPNGKSAHVCMGPTIDNQIIRFLFTKTAEACQELNVDNSLKQNLDEAISKLPPNQIGKDGRLMEWLEEYKEAEPHHRHISHLWGLYPGDEISLSTPDMAQAAKASLEARGDDGTGWSSAWKINFWARLHEGNRSLKLLQKLLKPTISKEMIMSGAGGTYPNLFCAHPPFQIDGNFGGTAGIAEMLIQSHEEYIELLPALPSQWKDGHFDRLCVRGGGEVSLSWNNYQPQSMSLKSTIDNTFNLKIPKNITRIELKSDKNKPQTIEPSSEILTIQSKKGETFYLKFM